MVEVNCETDFVAKEDKFRVFAQALATRALTEGPADVAALGAASMEAGGGSSVEDQRRELIAQVGENITIRRLALVNSEGGALGSYSHGGRIGVLVDLDGGDAEIGKDMAMHIAASHPLAIGGGRARPRHARARTGNSAGAGRRQRQAARDPGEDGHRASQ